jgi:cell division protein FtsB
MSNLPTWAGAEIIRMEDEHSVSMYASSKDAEIARLRAENERLRSDIERLQNKLRAIYQMEGRTLLGGSDCRDKEHAHQVGAHLAFNQCADMARGVLRGESDAEIARLRAENERLREMVKLHCDPFYMTPEDQALWEALRGESD